MASGIGTFFDTWEIRSGDSLRQRIDAGIEGCTHFLVFLSPTSLTKPWVNAELDAGFMAKLFGRARLIPLRIGLAPEQLPPLLRGLRSPSLDNFDVAMRELIADILGVTQRPPLGSIPAFATRAIKEDAGLSALAGRIATYFVQASVQARFGDPQLPVEELRRLAGTNDDDIAEAVDELESLGWVSPSRALGAGELGFVRLMPKPRLFARLRRPAHALEPRGRCQNCRSGTSQLRRRRTRNTSARTAARMDSASNESRDHRAHRRWRGGAFTVA